MCPADNNGTDGVSAISSVTDVQGHTYTQRAIANRDPGAAAAGATGAIFTATVGASGLAATDNVSVNFSPNTTYKCLVIYKITGSVASPSFVSAGTETVGAGTTFAHTTPSVTTGEVVMCVASVEVHVTTFGAFDSDTTCGSWTTVRVFAVAGAVTTGMKIMTAVDEYGNLIVTEKK